MAGVRRAGTRRLETVVLRDMRCVQTIRWTHLYACPSPLPGIHTSTDGDRLLCNETLDDLNHVWQSLPDPQDERQSSSQASQGMWQSPPDPQDERQSSAQAGQGMWQSPPDPQDERQSSSQASQGMWQSPPDPQDERQSSAQAGQGMWQSPPDPQDERQSSAQAGQGIKSSGSCSTCSPETHRPVPPNSPADAVGRAGAAQCSANAYITYLARSWRAGEAQSPRGTAFTSAARHMPAADGALSARSTSRPAGQKHVLLLGPDSSVDHLAAFVSAHDVEGEDDVAMRGRDDILVIPDDTAGQLTSEPRVRPVEQCVPADDAQLGSVDADDDSLFVEDAWLATAPSLCHNDHVVPRRVPWEE